ncbi:protein MANNAN SYNTHESIS-RELATED 1 [Andrographis paniculata]|uniref:protein MANNAN SYNTHESIS-RELATED 1 n=1 Tax=Andrographis paniculata TaxID=175694 RepID=UPI0021E7FC1C|nr:protein MANNAN SYNTHESIS-RELATED 1 [Andrographis paniculata]
MAVDPRQILAGVLTVTMFVMLGDMIKRDHFDPPVIHNSNKVSEQGIATVTKEDDGPWKEDGLTLKPCWEKPVLEETDASKGHITFSLTNGPEYHVSQIADAVVVARYLRATLVIPDIRGSKPGDKRNFEDVYDVDKFINTLNGVVKVVKTLPTGITARKLAVVKVPNRVTEEEIAENIEPVFRAKGNIRLTTYFPSVNMKKGEERTNADSIACLAMFGTLEPQPEVREVIDSMLDRLRTISRKSNGQFVAVDLRVDILEKKGCHKNDDSGSKSCYNAEEIAHFLRSIGFEKDTTVYVTQTKWDPNLDALKKVFPKTYTKSSIMPMEKKDKFLGADSWEYEEVIDFYISSESDVFVPAISGLFYANVAGKRIGSGRTQILVPTNIPDSSTSHSSEEFISHYVSKKNHFAYSCFC